MSFTDDPVDKKTGNSQSRTFIIRIWNERVKENGIVDYWHGAIDQVGSNNRLYFYSLDSITQFIREQTGVSFTAGKPWWQTTFTKITGEFANKLRSFRRDGNKRQA